MSDTQRDLYVNPLATRYASREMLELFGENRKFRTWRRLWLALARTERDLGLAISPEQLAEMEAHLDDIDYETAERREREVRHDVMAHVHAFGGQCPKAAPIIHLGATSAYVVDNTDVILLREALGIVRARIVAVVAALRDLAETHRTTPCLSYTHFQPAQPTTFGRRACLWIQDLLLDLEECEWRRRSLRFLGAKGATGTQASFLTLFGGDHEKVRELDRRVALAMGFERSYTVTGQTPPRKVDAQALQFLSGTAQSIHKFSNDVRLLMGLGHVEEPTTKGQIGSSAMAYKKNPMRCERMTSLARVAMALAGVAEQTAAEQWFERTLDDSAGKRIAVPESFLAIDAALLLQLNVAKGMVVFPAALMRDLKRELPAMATEDIMMLAVQRGGDRQALHERIRIHSRAAAQRQKEEGVDSDLTERIAGDSEFASVKCDLGKMLDPARFTGRSEQQVREFLDGEVAEVLARNADATGPAADDVRV
ncbi:MAG: adenylosuccinate lyase [Planctomycetes bacterium]|nr:adenylosuccinate lyase [Planctomycetota bacterium]